MTDAIGPSVVEVARALAAAKQNSLRSIASAGPAESPATGRTGNEGDRVTLSEAAREAVRHQAPGGTLIEGRRPVGKLITLQDQRAEAEAAIQQMMADLGIEGDLAFSIGLHDDASIAATGAGPHAAEIEAAINGDPAFQGTLRSMRMFSGFTYMVEATRAEREQLNAAETPSSPDQWHDLWSAPRERTEAARYTLTMTDGVLSTAFVDDSGEHFGGVAPEQPPGEAEPT